MKGNHPVKFKIKRNITLPLIKLQVDVPVYVKITSQIVEGKGIDAGRGDKKMKPAALVDCINLETGEEARFIVSAVLRRILEDEFPDNGYVGKAFSITKLPKAEGKAYHTFSVAELDIAE